MSSKSSDIVTTIVLGFFVIGAGAIFAFAIPIFILAMMALPPSLPVLVGVGMLILIFASLLAIVIHQSTTPLTRRSRLRAILGALFVLPSILIVLMGAIQLFTSHPAAP